MYEYKAVVVRWVDADTVVVDIDLGLHTWRRGEHLRLIGIDAPDKQPAKGEASLYARRLAPDGTTVTVQTYKDDEDKYGRLLADVYVGDLNINDALVDAGHARPYDGGAR